MTAQRTMTRRRLALIGLGTAAALLVAGVIAASPAAPAASAAVAPTPAAAPISAAVALATPAAEATPPVFSGAAALKDVAALAKIGIRKAGSLHERQGADYIAKRLRSFGYHVDVRTFKLPNGRTSRNVVARASGESTRVIVLGAHMDTKSPSPGANDNASGCAALIEIARKLVGRPLYADVEFVFFGSEEMIDRNPDHHHYGSRRYVKTLSATARKAVSAMISVDMIGAGTSLTSRTMGIGTKRLSNLLVARAKAAGFTLKYLRDPSTAGWSDHEPFERIGIPVSWLEWRNDPYYHTRRDTAGRVSRAKVARVGQLVLDFVLGADEAMLSGVRGY